MTATSLAMRVVHAGLAIVLVGWLISVLVDRRSELAKVRSLAEHETTEKDRAKAELSRGQALRDGLKRDDPYVVEYLARERLQFAGPGELAPPPRTTRPNQK